ncbi:MAG: response regulator [Planctomycetes bacterium]|nr:response regulator [Planctomycetota bacterium]
MPSDASSIEQELALLRRENERLRDEARSVASANVNAAQQMVEMSMARQRELEEQNRRIEAALAIAEQASVQKTMFLANISHELRTPLNGIIGMASVLLESERSGERREDIEMLLRSGEMLLEIVNDILDFSKIEADHCDLEREPFDLWKMSEDLTGLLYAGNRGKDFEVRLEIDPMLPRTIIGDQLRLRQVLMNLAGNATKFTDRGEVVIRMRAMGPVLHVEVTDTGCGLDSKSIGRLFEPFTQVDNSAARRKGGTGLGLAISRRLIRKMGGDILVESELGRGSRFWFVMPLEVPVAKAPPLEARFGVAVLHTDDGNARRTVESHLRAIGIDVRDAAESPMPPVNGPALWLLDTAATGVAPERWSAMVGQDDRVVLLGSSDPDQTLPWRDAYPAARVLRRPLLPTALLQLCTGEPERGAASADRAVVAEVAATRVLLVEDNPINARVASSLLRSMGCSVDEAASGVEALTAVGRCAYDVILMDCQMPEMDGYEAAARIRELERDTGHRARIVALTAHAMAEDRHRCFSLGMDDYLTKPVSRAALAAAVGSARSPS